MVRWADQERITAAVAAYAGELSRRRGVTAVYWYGSWVSGIPTPSSDVALSVVADRAPSRHRAIVSGRRLEAPPLTVQASRPRRG